VVFAEAGFVQSPPPGYMALEITESDFNLNDARQYLRTQLTDNMHETVDKVAELWRKADPEAVGYFDRESSVPKDTLQSQIAVEEKQIAKIESEIKKLQGLDDEGVYVCVHVSVCMCMCVCVHMCVCMCAHVCVYVHMCVCMCAYMFVCVCMCVCVCVHMCVCVCVHMCACIRV
jgi:hypothetical protein